LGIIRYTYGVGTHTYRGDTDTSATGFVIVRTIVARHPVGASVSVRYDPEHPDRSVLDSWLSWNHVDMWLQLGAAGALIGVGPLLVVLVIDFGVRARRARVCEGRDRDRDAIRLLRPRP